MTTHLAPPSVHSVWFEWVHDPEGEPDYLERSAADHFGVDGANWSHVSEDERAKVIAEHGSIWKACEHYARGDAERLKEFQADAWWFETCRAEAEVRYELYDGSFRIERLRSGGLSGIESDSGEEYRRSVEVDELADLSSHMERFGVARSSVDDLLALCRH